MRADDGAVEGPREVGVARVPVVPVADQQRVEALPCAVLERYPPAPVSAALGALHRRLEADVIAQREGVGVVAQPLEDMCVVRIVRIAIRHREVAKGDRRPGDVDVQRAVRGREPVRVLEVPVPADLVGGLEARERHAEVAERLAAVSPLTPAPMTHTEGSASIGRTLTRRGCGGCGAGSEVRRPSRRQRAPDQVHGHRGRAIAHVGPRTG